MITTDGLGGVEREVRRQTRQLHVLRTSAIQRRLQFSFELAALIYGVRPHLLRSSHRHSRAATDARQVAMYIANVALGIDFEDIGEFANRNRDTIRHGVERVEDRREDPGFDALITSMEVLISDLKTEPVARALCEGVKVDFAADPSLFTDELT